MGRHLPRYHTEHFTIEFNDKGQRFSAKAKLTIDLNEIRYTLGRHAAHNAGRRSRAGQCVVELVTPCKSLGEHQPEKGTVCYE